MKVEQEMVKEFHRTFGLLANDKPTIPSEDEIDVCFRLIEEEEKELIVAVTVGDIVEIADALGDLLYVTLGMANRFGIDMEPIFHEIQRSNMSKVGGHKDEKGKWIKPESYSPANLLPILIEQGYET